jgi:class 3 adenylate cyclase
MKRFSGTHISRAARLEPVTPPNQVYASQGFAALCECMSVTSFRCDFVGTLPLAKGYGNFPVYHVRRTG